MTDLGAVMGWLILRAVAAVDRRQDQCDERAKETARELTEQRVALALLQGESAAYQHIQAQLARRLKD